MLQYTGIKYKYEFKDILGTDRKDFIYRWVHGDRISNLYLNQGVYLVIDILFL